MKNYDRINALPPEGIESKRAHIVGGGIAGFATAAFLVDDAHMPAANITIYEALDVDGGCLDAAGDSRRRVQESRIAHVRAALRVPVLPAAERFRRRRLRAARSSTRRTRRTWTIPPARAYA